MDAAEALKTGARIQSLRQSFNIREGIRPADVRLPDRMAGRPPLAEGPLKGVTIDIDTLSREYRTAMGWDPETGVPTKNTLEELGLSELLKTYG
jgi:aldehyde:ferredoxin oxidoreductase